MAFDFIPKLTTHLSLVFLLVLSMTKVLAQTAHAEKCRSEKVFEMTYGVLVQYNDPNATEVPIAGIAGEPRSPGTYGTLSVADIPMREGPSPYSREVGRIQGLVLVASKVGSIHYISATVIFTSSKYKNSTIQLQGVDEWESEEASDFSIVGGTKMWKGAKGIFTYRPSAGTVTMKVSVPCWD